MGISSTEAGLIDATIEMFVNEKGFGGEEEVAKGKRKKKKKKKQRGKNRVIPGGEQITRKG